MTRRTMRWPAGLVALALVTAWPLAAAAQNVTPMSSGARSFGVTTVPAAATEFDLALGQWITGWTGQTRWHLERALVLDPSFAMARILGAGRLPVHQRRAEFERARDDAASRSPAELLIAAAALEGFDNRPMAALQLRMTALDLLKDDPRASVYVAWLLPVSLRIPQLEAIVARHPRFAAGWAALAWAHTPQPFGEISPASLQGADRALMEVDRLAPDSLWPLWFKGHNALRRGDLAGAEQYLSMAVTRGPSEAALQLLAELRLKQGRYADAREALRDAEGTVFDPGSVYSLRTASAYSWLYEGKYPEAVRQLEAITREALDDPSVSLSAARWPALAQVAAAAGDGPAFDRYLAEALQTVPPGGNRDWLIFAYGMLGRGAEARAELQPYLDVMQDAIGPEAEYSRERIRGWVAIAEGKYAEAERHLLQAGRNPWSTLGLLEAYRGQGKTAEAAAVSQDMLTRMDFGWASSATPIARYRIRAGGR